MWTSEFLRRVSRDGSLTPLLQPPKGDPPMKHRKLLGAVAASALLFAIPVPAAHADTYAPEPGRARTSTAQGGWTTSAKSSRPRLRRCSARVSATPGRPAARTATATSPPLSAASPRRWPATSTSIWQSPAFTYNGLGGNEPGSVTFDMNMLRTSARCWTSRCSTTPSFGVDLVDQANGTQVSVIPSTRRSREHQLDRPPVGVGQPATCSSSATTTRSGSPRPTTRSSP